MVLIHFLRSDKSYMINFVFSEHSLAAIWRTNYRGWLKLVSGKRKNLMTWYVHVEMTSGQTSTQAQKMCHSNVMTNSILCQW